MIKMPKDLMTQSDLIRLKKQFDYEACQYAHKDNQLLAAVYRHMSQNVLNKMFQKK